MRKFCRILVVDSLRQISASFTAVSIVFAAILLLSTSQRAHAATYTVCPLPGDCNFQTPDAAVNDPGIVDGDIIDITTDNYVLGDPMQALGDPMQAAKSITINGNGSTLDANNNRALEVSGTSLVVTVNDVNIFNGQDPGEGSGGAIRVTGGAQLILNRAIIENSSANDSGGGLSNSDSIVDIFDSAFIGNYADFSGGAIRTWGPNAVTNLTRTNIDSNQSGVVGGGIATANGGTINVFESTITNNVALSSSVIIDNITGLSPSNNCGGSPYGQTFLAGAGAISGFSYRVVVAGGGIPTDLIVPGRLREDGPNGPLLATTSVIIPAGSTGTLILEFILDSPVAMDPLATYAIETEVVGNYSVVYTPTGSYADGQAYACTDVLGPADYDFQILGGTPGDGGGAYSDGTNDPSDSTGTINLINSTVSGNIGDGAFASAGNNVVSAAFSTVVNNSGNGLTAEAGNPGGVIAFGGSILAGNGGSDCFRNDLNAFAVSADFNLIGDISGCQFIALQTNDQAGGAGLPIIDPLLGILQDNGGSTFTHALDENSPAVDEGGACHLTNNPLLNDQRGTVRPNGTDCDIGSFEYAPPPGPLQTLINAAEAGATITVPDGTYAEPITIGDGKILSGSGPGNVIIDASNLNSSAITATGDFALIGIRVTGGSSAGHGGGIFADIAGTDISLNNVVFDNNVAVLNGGAIYLRDGSLSAVNTTFTSNSAGETVGAVGNGGAIFSGTSATISGSLFSLNQASGNGGAIFNNGTLSLVDSTIEESSASLGGGFYNNTNAVATISGTTLNNNDANGSGTVGGAIGGAGTLEITNSTLSGNTTSTGNGGGIGLRAGSALLNNVTLAINGAELSGGPLYADPGALISFRNSLFSGNSGGGTDCDTVVSLGYNLFENTPCTPAAGDIVSDPLIDFLASNGGPTQTHALDPISPARDAADPGQLVIELSSALSASQLTFNGAADAIGGVLIPVSGVFVAGSIYATAPDEGPFDLAGSFSTQFSFQITDPVAWSGNPGEPSGDGFTFAIAASPTVLGEPGGRLGVATTPGPLGTVSVEFDTYFNGGDISTNAIGVNVGGFGNGDSVISATQAAIPGAFDDGNVWSAWIDYRADSQRLEVRVAPDGVRPDLPQLTHTVDIEAEVGASGYYGFTGGTGLANATHSVTAWELFSTNCPTFDQRGVDRPFGAACDIGAVEGSPIPLALDPDTPVVLAAVTSYDQQGNSYPGVVDVPIIDIPIEKLTGDTFNAPESAPLGSFPLGSFPIGSFDLRSSPLGSFPLGSFPIGSFPLGSFPLGSFPLSSIPLLSTGGWTEILNDIPELAGAPLQTVTLEQLLTLSPQPDSIATIALRDLAIEGSPLASLSLPGLSLGDTTVAELDEWAANADPATSDNVCDTLSAEDSTFSECGDQDTLLGLEVKGAPVSALSLSSLPLGSFPIGSFPIGSFPIGSFPLGSFPLGSFPIGSFPIGSFPLGSFPLGSFPIGSFPIGSFNLLAAPIGSFPLGSFPIGSFPLGSFEIDGKSFCEFYDEQALAGGDANCADLAIDPGTDNLADLVLALQNSVPGSNIGSTPLGSFPLGSFPIGSFPIGSFDLATLGTLPFSELKLIEINGCAQIAGNSSDSCNSLGLTDQSTLEEAATAYGGTLAASPIGSFPIGSFDVASLPIGSFPIGSYEVNGAPLGSFPLGSFDLIGSPIGSFPIGSFPLGSFPVEIVTDPEGLCADCQTLADAAKAGVINPDATLLDLQVSTEFASTTLGEVLDAMTLSTLYCPPDPDPSVGPVVECAETLGEIKDPGNLTLGQLLIAMMLKTDFPWETIPLEQLDTQTFSADNFVDYTLDIPLTGTESEPFSIAINLADSFLYVNGSALLDIASPTTGFSSESIADPVIIDNGDGTQTLNFNLVLSGFSNNRITVTTVPPLALGDYPATATVELGSDDPVDADAGEGMLTIISDDISVPDQAVTTPADILELGYISTPDDNDFYRVAPPAVGDRVAVFMSNPAGDNDLIMYEPLSTVEAKGQTAESAPLDSVPFEDDGVDYEGNISEEPNALEDVNLANAPLASISTNRGTLDESVSAIAGKSPGSEFPEPFTIQVSGYNGAISDQPYTLRVKVTPRVPSPQCTARSWPDDSITVPVTEGSWMPDTNAVFLINYARLAASDPDGVAGADAALAAINNLVTLPAPGITNGVVIDVSTIFQMEDLYDAWDDNPCDVDAANDIVNAITRYIEEQRLGLVSSALTYVTIVGSDEVIPFARKPDETSIANESTFAGEFSDNAMFGALITRHFLSDDPYGDIDPIPWLDRYLNVPELAVGRLVESAADIQLAAENYLAFGGILDPQSALSAGYDFVADAAEDIDETFNAYSTELGYSVETALIDPPGITPDTRAWGKTDFLRATGISGTNPVDLVSFNMHFDFDEALPSIGDATGNYTDNLINTADLAGSDLTGGIWFTVGCHSGSSVADVSVVGAPSEDWAQTFGRQGALYVAQNAYGLGDTEAVALTERLMANFASNLNGHLTIGQAHAFAKQQYFAGLGLYGEYDFKALQAATLFGLPMYQYGYGATVTDPPAPALPVSADPISNLQSATWTVSGTGITQRTTDSKGELFSVAGEVQFVHFRPLQPIVRRDVTNPNGDVASGAFLTSLTTEDLTVMDIAFARPVIDLGENEPEIETDEVVFPTAFTNISNYKAPPTGGGPFEPRDQLNVIVGQFTSPLDGASSGTERLFRNFDAQIFYRPAAGDDFKRPEFDNVQASVVGSTQAAFSVDVTDETNDVNVEGEVLRVAVLYLQSVTGGNGNWVLVDLVKGGGNTWTGGGPVELSGIENDQVDYMVQAVDANGNVANSTFKGLFYVAETIPNAPDGEGPDDPFEVTLSDPNTNPPTELDNDGWNQVESIQVDVTTNGTVTYEYSVDGSRPLMPLGPEGFVVSGDGIHIIQLFGSDGSQETFVLLIDNTEPEIIISTPADGSYVVQGLAPPADFLCRDSGSGTASCSGDVAAGVTVPDGDVGVQTFSVNATDKAGLGFELSHTYYVVEQLNITGPPEPVSIGTEIEISATATDLGTVQYVEVNWGDGTTSTAPGDVMQDESTFTANHVYTNPGVYQITVRIEDGGAYVQTGVFEFAVIYDPSSGFVTGGGWIDSPTGAYTPNDDSDTDVMGKAHFGFISKYKKGQSIPSGSTSFRFAAGNLEFDATDYEWMIITGARARYKGEGTVEGMTGLYKFQVTALDADASGGGICEDGFRIKIWQEGSGVLYDNGRGADDATGNGGTTPLGGGSIKVHKAK